VDAGGPQSLTLVAAIMILAGLVGVVVPVLPALPLAWGGVLVWALGRQDGAGWATLAVATVIAVVGLVVKYLLPGRRLRASGVPTTSLLAGGALGVVGFFVVPVIGAVLGFVLGVYLGERARLRAPGSAWPSTRSALAAVGWSMAIELLAGLLVAGTWVTAVVLA
jgi:uncharacterized protein YqgC (DUF456 family)